MTFEEWWKSYVSTFTPDTKLTGKQKSSAAYEAGRKDAAEECVKPDEFDTVATIVAKMVEEKLEDFKRQIVSECAEIAENADCWQDFDGNICSDHNDIAAAIRERFNTERNSNA